MNTSTAILFTGGAILLVIGFYLPPLTFASLSALVLGGFALAYVITELFR